jgi:hypothetical protein
MRHFGHFLITRFNSGSIETGLDRDWLTRRFELFDRFCYPTVRSQTVTDFSWLVFFSERTPTDFRARISGYAKWPVFQPVFLATGTSITTTQQCVRDRLSRGAELLITTRLDSDDGICRGFIEGLQRAVGKGEMHVLEYPNGYVWHQDRIYSDYQPCNPFSTLIEPLPNGSHSDFRTVYCVSHPNIAELAPIVCVSTQPAWIQVVHGANLSNKVRGIRQPITKVVGTFELDIRRLQSAEKAWQVRLDTVATAVKMGLRRAAHGTRSWVRRLWTSAKDRKCV